ncbi:AlbA family DNA-binding domain-containing protein [Jatrophihabitans sp. YIM 134969]
MSGAVTVALVGASVLLIGFTSAAVARLALRGRGNALSWSASTLCGIVGAASGSTVTGLLLERPLRDAPVVVVFGGLAGTVVVIAVADAVVRRRRPSPPTVAELVHAGESQDVEFKSSARYNLHTRTRDARLELVVARTVAGFADARGGTLLIGVSDDGTPLGLEEDYSLVKNGSRDGFELWLRDLLATTLGGPVAAATAVGFDQLQGHDVCVVRVAPAAQPVFFRAPRQQGTEFVLRVGNSTRVLPPHELLDYASTRWRRRTLRSGSLRPVRRDPPDPDGAVEDVGVHDPERVVER